MKIAVIGATGMLGCHIAHAVIEQGHSLVVIHRNSSRLDKLHGLPFTSRIASLEGLDSLVKALAGVDAVIHAAAYYPTVPRSWKKDLKLARDQMALFLSACKQAHAVRPLRVVYVGAAIALQRGLKGAPGNERNSYPSQPRDKNNYVQTKWAMDTMALQAASEGLPVVIGIPTMTFGEHDDGNTTGRLVLEIARGTLPGYLQGERNVVYAGDAAHGLVLCAEKGRSGERYLITGRNTTMDDLVHMISAQAGQAMPKVIPLRLARLVAKLGSIKYRLFRGAVPKLSKSAVAVMASGQYIDGSKAQEELGYAPRVSLAETIERSLNWFRAQGMVGHQSDRPKAEPRFEA
jgi:dihydroflavonol-4-reductase